MDTRQIKYAQMQTKLRNGLANLNNISPDDSSSVGAALLQLHGALEDYVRLSVVEKAPHLQDQVEDMGKVKWKELLEYGRTYLGFTKTDCDTIAEANRQRNNFAHGDPHSYTFNQLKAYAGFVQRWCDSSQPVQKAPVSKPKTEPTYYPPSSINDAQRQDSYAPLYPSPYQKPWYRSTPILFLTFFLLPPVWAILIITDQNQGCFAKSIGFLIIIQLFLCISGFLYLDGFPLYQNLPNQINNPNSFTKTPSGNTIPNIIETSSPPFETTISGTNATCAIIWAEDTDADLAGKSRATVWEEIVMSRVSGSDMTARQFYDLVVMHNPDLITDGYEFKEGKTYILPGCQ